MTPGSQNLGWSFDNGQEFKGATGSLALDPDHKREDHDALKLTGDFTAGGAYVRANCPIPSVEIDKLTIWFRSPSMGQVTLRLVDETGQCHQLKVNISIGSSWDRLVLPVADYFAGKEPGARQDVTIVNGYESWGGANDQKWHGVCKSLDVIIGPTSIEKVVSIWIADASVTVKAPPPPATP